MGKLFKGVVLGTALSALFGAWLKKPQGQKAKQAAEEFVRSLLKRGGEVAVLSKESYMKILDTAVEELKKMKTLSERELQELRTDFETKWETLGRRRVARR